MFLLPEARERLAAQQAALLRALADRAAPPDGFDPARLRATADALARKRARGVARAWPSLAGAGRPFRAALRRLRGRDPPAPPRWAPRRRPRLRPRARRLGRIAGGRPRRGDGCRLAPRPAPDGLAPRRWPSLAVALLYRPRRLVLAARLPRLGERWLAIRLALKSTLVGDAASPLRRTDAFGI